MVCVQFSCTWSHWYVNILSIRINAVLHWSSMMGWRTWPKYVNQALCFIFYRCCPWSNVDDEEHLLDGQKLLPLNDNRHRRWITISDIRLMLSVLVCYPPVLVYYLYALVCTSLLLVYTHLLLVFYLSLLASTWLYSSVTCLFRLLLVFTCHLLVFTRLLLVCYLSLSYVTCIYS